MVPDLTYDGLAVADGMTANVKLAQLMLEGDSWMPAQRETERRDLLEYCKLDTEAMVRLLEKLEELAGEGERA